MFLLILVVLGSICGAFALAVIHAETASAWWRALPQRLRGPGWGLLLLPAAAMAAVMAGGVHALAVVELAIAGLLVICAPRLAAKVVPYAVLGLAVEGLILAKDYHDGFNNPVLYGLVLAGSGSWRTRLVLPEAGLFLVLGLWLLLVVRAPGAGLVRALSGRWLDPRRGGIKPAQGLLLLPVVAMAMQLLGPGGWFGFQSVSGLDVAVIDLVLATASVVLVLRSRPWAATLAKAGLLVLGGYGLLIAVFWPAVPGFGYGFADLTGPRIGPLGVVALEGTVLLAAGLWLAPRVMREHLSPPADPELAARARQLTERVQTLTQTRSDAVDTAVAELRRIERDLHDGAQARLVALGMSLQAAERLFATNPRGGARAGHRGQGELLPCPDRAARPGPRHLPAGARRPRPRRRDPGAGPGHAAAHVLDIDLPGRGRDAGRRPPSTSRSPRCWPTRPSTPAPARSRSGSARWPGRCARGHRRRRGRRRSVARAPGWPGWSAGSRRLMASWR